MSLNNDGIYYNPHTKTVSFALRRHRYSQAKKIADILCGVLRITDISSVPAYKLHRNEDGTVVVTIQDKNLIKNLTTMSSPDRRISTLLEKNT